MVFLYGSIPRHLEPCAKAGARYASFYAFSPYQTSPVSILQCPTAETGNNYILMPEGHQYLTLSYLKFFQAHPEETSLNCTHFESTSSYIFTEIEHLHEDQICHKYRALLNSSPSLPKIIVEKHLMIAVNQTSLCSKIVHLQTFATISDKLYHSTFSRRSYTLDANSSPSPPFKISYYLPLGTFKVSLQHLNHLLSVRNAIICTSCIFSFSASSSKLHPF